MTGPDRHVFPTPHQIAECGGPCLEGGSSACDCGLWERSRLGELSDDELSQAARAAIADYRFPTELVYFLDADSFEHEPLLLALRGAIAADRARLQLQRETLQGGDGPSKGLIERLAHKHTHGAELGASHLWYDLPALIREAYAAGAAAAASVEP